MVTLVTCNWPMPNLVSLSIILAFNTLFSGVGCFGKYYHWENNLGIAKEEVSIGLWDEWWDRAAYVMKIFGKDEYETELHAVRGMTLTAFILSLIALVFMLLTVYRIARLSRLVLVFEICAMGLAIGAVAVWSSQMPWESNDIYALSYGFGFFMECVLIPSSLVGTAGALRVVRHQARGNPVGYQILD